MCLDSLSEKKYGKDENMSQKSLIAYIWALEVDINFSKEDIYEFHTIKIRHMEVNSIVLM